MAVDETLGAEGGWRQLHLRGQQREQLVVSGTRAAAGLAFVFPGFMFRSHHDGEAQDGATGPNFVPS
jgi:hypothetical protein